MKSRSRKNITRAAIQYISFWTCPRGVCLVALFTFFDFSAGFLGIGLRLRLAAFGVLEMLFSYSWHGCQGLYGNWDGGYGLPGEPGGGGGRTGLEAGGLTG